MCTGHRLEGAIIGKELQLNTNVMTSNDILFEIVLPPIN